MLSNPLQLLELLGYCDLQTLDTCAGSMWAVNFTQKKKQLHPAHGRPVYLLVQCSTACVLCLSY